MSLAYQIMYRFGATPWEHREPPEPLADLIQGPRALPPGDMLDIGCGTGHDAIYCARHGWTVTGVDVVGRAVARAVDRVVAGAAADVEHVTGRQGIGALDQVGERHGRLAVLPGGDAQAVHDLVGEAHDLILLEVKLY